MTLVPEDPSEVRDFRLETGLAKLQRARRVYRTAILYEIELPQAANSRIRVALDLAASALYWLEGTDQEGMAHDELHLLGAYARNHHSHACQLHWTGERYEHRCPVRIAHKRIGFSVGFVGNRICSLCHQDVSECPHLPGRLYEVAAGLTTDGDCNICGAVNCGSHDCGETYRVRPHVVITEATLHEVSIVSRPLQPDARLTALPVETKRLLAHFGPRFQLGMRVGCDYCLTTCTGFDEVELPAG